MSLSRRLFGYRESSKQKLYAGLERFAEQSDDPDRWRDEHAKKMAAVSTTLTMQMMLGQRCKAPPPYKRDRAPFVLGYTFGYCQAVYAESNRDASLAMACLTFMHLYGERAGDELWVDVLGLIQDKSAPPFWGGIDAGIKDGSAYLLQGKTPTLLAEHLLQR